jgi:hypothetical protein
LLRRGVIHTLCDKVYQLHSAGNCFSPNIQVSTTNKTDRHDITEILLKVALKHHDPNPIELFNDYYTLRKQSLGGYI